MNTKKNASLGLLTQYISYNPDGKGRDWYISSNSGGFCKQYSHSLEVKNKFPVSVKFRPQNVSLHGALNVYRSDGSGRDSYILRETGGLKPDRKSLKSFELKDFLRTANQHMSNFVSNPDQRKIKWVSKEDFAMNEKSSKITKSQIKRLYNNELPKYKERFKCEYFNSKGFTNDQINPISQNRNMGIINDNLDTLESNNKIHSIQGQKPKIKISNHFEGINNIREDRIDTDEENTNVNYTQYCNTSSTNFKKFNYEEEKNKNEISTYLMGKTLSDLKSHNFNYFLAKKPKTSYLIKRNTDNPRMINPNFKNKFSNSGLYDKNNVDIIENIEKKNRLFSNSNVGIEEFVNNDEEINKLNSKKPFSNNEIKSPWNVNKNNIKKSNFKSTCQNTLKNDINNRNEIEGKKIYLPNLSNYDSNLSNGIKNIGDSIKFDNLTSRKEFIPLQTNSNFFYKNMKNSSLVSLKQKEHLDNVVKEMEFKFSREYYDGINKKIMSKKKPMTSISIKPKRLGVRSALSGQLDNKTSYKLIDEYLKKREIFG